MEWSLYIVIITYFLNKKQEIPNDHVEWEELS